MYIHVHVPVGMVVIGDPKAETTFKINMAGGRAILTSNTHYLPCSPSAPSDHGKSKTVSKQPSTPSSSPPLPTLTASLARSTVTITSAMYSGNATLETPQRNQTRVNISQLHISELENFTLGCMPDGMQSNRICSIPKLEIYRHLKTAGEADAISENDSSYLQLQVEEVSCVVSPKQISKTGHIYSSWYTGSLISGPLGPKIEGPSSSQDPKISAPLGPKIQGSSPSKDPQVHLHISIRDVELTTSTAATFTFSSVIVTSCSVLLLCDSTTGRLCHAVPILCGPIATGEWSSISAYYSEDWVKHQTRSAGNNSDRLIEFFTARPHEKYSGNIFDKVTIHLYMYMCKHVHVYMYTCK